MDVAYDHIQEESYDVPENQDKDTTQASRSGGLNAEFQEAFKAVSSSPWGSRLGGFLGQVKKQGESLYSEAQREYATASTNASRNLSDLSSNLAERARGISITGPQDGSATVLSLSDPTIELPASPTKTIRPSDALRSPSRLDAAAEDAGGGGGGKDAGDGGEAVGRPESLPADIVKEATNMVSKFRLDAAGRLKDIRKAEDAADEALLRFGTNIKAFFRDAVKITAPEGSGNPGAGEVKGEVLFETNDSDGKRVFHSSRFDAQLHVIMSRRESFLGDPESEEWKGFKEGWDAEKKTDAIAKELDRYEELRRVFGQLVPEKVDYSTFWARYYFLRGVVEEEERRRKEVLKGAVADASEEVGWGDEDEDEDESTTPVDGGKAPPSQASQSTTTLTPPKPTQPAAEHSSRRSNEDTKSTADSEASYDIVSGATSKTPGSPQDGKKDDSDDEDWE